MNVSKVNPSGSIRHYYVDEAGDGTLFDRKGRVIIGQEGCSRFTREARYGVYYTRKKPLTAAAFEGRL